MRIFGARFQCYQYPMCFLRYRADVDIAILPHCQTQYSPEVGRLQYACYNLADDQILSPVRIFRTLDGVMRLIRPAHPGLGFPRQKFATVDQFVVKALCQIPELPERSKLERMKPEGLTLADGRILTEIMQRKATENNQIFVTDFWTPRKIDMVLWASR